MRISYVFLGAFLAIAPAAYADVASPPVLEPLKQQAQAAQLSAKFLTRYSYKPVPLDDALSAKIMDSFVALLIRIAGSSCRQTSTVSSLTWQDRRCHQARGRRSVCVFNVYGKRVVDRMNYARDC